MKQERFFGGSIYFGSMPTNVTLASDRAQRVWTFIPVGQRRIKMPDATTVRKGWYVVLINDATVGGNEFAAADNTGAFIGGSSPPTAGPGEALQVVCVDNSTAGGQWFAMLKNATGAITGSTPARHGYIDDLYSTSPFVNNVIEYAHESGVWTVHTGNPLALRDFGAFSSVGAVGYHTGGASDDQANQSYDPPVTWTTKTSIPLRTYGIGFSSHAAAEVPAGKNTISSRNTWPTPSGATEQYDPATDAWTEKTACPKHKQDSGAAALGSFGYWVAGNLGGNSHHRYEELAGGTWLARKLRQPFSGKFTLVAESSGSRIYAVGGYIAPSSTLRDADEYDPTLNTWTRVADYPIGDEDSVMGAPGWSVDGSVYIAGGEKSGAGDRMDGFKYDPVAGIWTAITTAPTAMTNEWEQGAAITN